MNSVPRNELDAMLSDLLQANPRASYQDMANVTGASPTTVARRVTRLIESGAITITATSNVRTEGDQQTVVFGVAVDIGQLRMVAGRLATLPVTRWVGVVSGTHPLLVRVVLPPSVSLVDFILQEIATITQVRDVQTYAVLETVKALDMSPSHARAGGHPAEYRPRIDDQLAAD